jgi:hypothetical protein
MKKLLLTIFSATLCTLPITGAANSIEIKSNENLQVFEKKSENYLIAQSLNIQGRWKVQEGGTYYIRQIGNEIFWYGESPDAKTWANVFYGRITGNIVTGRWSDVPKGIIRNDGELELTIISPDKIKVKSLKGGNFAGTILTRIP